MITAELTFSNLVDIPSYPAEFLGFKDFIILSTSLVNRGFNFILGKGVLKDCNK